LFSYNPKVKRFTYLRQWEMNMPTIKDIAREANVSVTTVSNVIHGKSSHVAQDTIEEINKIIAKYNYTPNMSARALVNKSSRIIGVINHLIPYKKGSFLEDPFHTTLIGGIEKQLRLRDYYMMLRTVETEEELFALFRNWNLDGLILTGLFEDIFFERLIQAGKPIVLLDSYIKNKKIFNVGLEDYQGGYLATKHLIEKGHRSIVFASPTILPTGVISERFKGYKAALKEAGIKYSEKNVYQQEIHLSDGILLGKQLSERKDITAIFATADLLATGIMTGLSQNGVKVPDDISVIGFDDSYLANLTVPPLTTIHQDAAEKGEIAVDLLIDFLQNKTTDTSNVIMPVSLVERSTVKDIH
jgi:LacI family transcriptional regulator